MCWTVRGSDLGGGEFFRAVQTDFEAHTASCTMESGSFVVVIRLDRGAEHSRPSNTDVANGMLLFLRLPCVPAEDCCYRVPFIVTTITGLHLWSFPDVDRSCENIRWTEVSNQGQVFHHNIKELYMLLIIVRSFGYALWQCLWTQWWTFTFHNGR